VYVSAGRAEDGPGGVATMEGGLRYTVRLRSRTFEMMKNRKTIADG